MEPRTLTLNYTEDAAAFCAALMYMAISAGDSQEAEQNSLRLALELRDTLKTSPSLLFNVLQLTDAAGIVELLNLLNQIPEEETECATPSSS